MTKKRTSFTQLPSQEEIEEMMAKESVRKPIAKKETIHYPEFETFFAWLQAVGESSDFMEDASLQAADILQEAEEVKLRVVAKTLEAKGGQQLQEALQAVEDYLSAEDDLKAADMIMVLGNHNIKRAEHAAKLFKQGLAPLVVITGGNPNYEEDRFPEGVAFARRAMEHGVPKDRILIEANSITIADNLKTTFNLLDLLGVGYTKKGIISVNEWTQQQRAWSSIMKLSLGDTKVMKSNAPVLKNEVAQGEWLKNETGLHMIFNEFVKMHLSTKLGNIA